MCGGVWKFLLVCVRSTQAIACNAKSEFSDSPLLELRHIGFFSESVPEAYIFPVTPLTTLPPHSSHSLVHRLRGRSRPMGLLSDLASHSKLKRMLVISGIILAVCLMLFLLLTMPAVCIGVCAATGHTLVSACFISGCVECHPS